MRDPDEDVCYEILRQKRADSGVKPARQRVGTTVQFSRTTDKDPNPRIPLSVPSEVPSVWWAVLLGSIATLLLLAAWVA